MGIVEQQRLLEDTKRQLYELDQANRTTENRYYTTPTFIPPPPQIADDSQLVAHHWPSDAKAKEEMIERIYMIDRQRFRFPGGPVCNIPEDATIYPLLYQHVKRTIDS